MVILNLVIFLALLVLLAGIFKRTEKLGSTVLIGLLLGCKRCVIAIFLRKACD